MIYSRVQNLHGYLLSDRYTYQVFLDRLVSLSELEKGQFYDLVISEFSCTEEHIFRNRLAIALMELKNSSCIPFIMEKLKDERTLGYRGTLLFALKEFDPIDYFKDFVFLAVNSGLEVRWNAIDLIEGLSIVRSCEAELMIDYINGFIDESDEERKEDLLYLIDVLRSAC